MILILGDLHIGLEADLGKIRWLKRIFEYFSNIEMLILLGDIFDFYFECPQKAIEKYGEVIDIIADVATKKPVFYIQGNHDFFPLRLLQERGVKTVSKDISLFWNEKSIYFTHGDLLTPPGVITRAFLTIKLWQFFMKLLPCNLIYSIAQKISKWSRKRSSQKEIKKAVQKKLEKLLLKHEIVITAHLHRPIVQKYNSGKIYINPGDWLSYYTFVTLENNRIILWELKEEQIKEKEVIML